MAPGGKSELARAGTCATERSKNHATGASDPHREMWYQLSSGSQEQEAAPQGGDEVATKTGTERTCNLRPLGRRIRSLRNRASGLAK